jgi:hypothetical protein
MGQVAGEGSDFLIERLRLGGSEDGQKQEGEEKASHR